MPAALLCGAALRVTRPRLAAVHEHPHADTDGLIGAVRTDLGAVSHQAVYDVLRALSDADQPRLVAEPGGPVGAQQPRRPSR